MNKTGAKLYVGNFDSNSVSVIDTPTNAVIADIPVASGASAVALNPAGTRLYAATSGATNAGHVLRDNVVSVIDTATNMVIATVPVGVGPAGVAVNPAGTFAYAVNSGSNNVSVIDTSTHTVIATVGVGNLPITFGHFIAPPINNTPPVADAGADQRVECSSHAGTPVILDGLASSDPDGNALHFEWRDADGHIVGTDAVVNLTLPLGTHTFTLNVDDDHGGMASDMVNIVVQDTTPPVLTLAADSVTVVVPTASATGAMVDVLAASGVRAGDLCDPAPTITHNGPADGVFPIGITIVTVTATDHSGNSSQARFTVQVVYNSSGFLAPIRSDGSSIFKSGRVILIRFQLTAADGTFVSNAAATLAVFKVTDDVLGTVEVESAGNSNEDNTFRYDLDTNQYLFNLSSSGYSAGTYLLRVMLNDGTIHDVLVSVR